MMGDLLYRVLHDPKLPGESRLFLAVIGMALRDARQGNGHAGSAWEFLTGDGFKLYARALGFDPDELMRRLVPELWDR